MAPIEPDLSNSNLKALSLFAGYFAVTCGLTGLISYDVLYKAWRALPPSQDTRHRQSSREKHVQLFAALAFLSLVVPWYHIARYLALSYNIWAHEMGQELPDSLFSRDGFSNIALGRWLQDTSLWQDAWEITIEKSRRYWWTQQLLLGLAAWSVYVGLEGRRRHVRHLWAFLLLGQGVGLSFAMNLFFVAILLAPIPLPLSEKQSALTTSKPKPSATTALTLQDRLKQAYVSIKPYLPPPVIWAHPSIWTPHPLALITPVIALHVTTFLLPFSTSTPLFAAMLSLNSVIPYRLVYSDRLAPVGYGSMSKPNRSYLSVYRFLSYTSYILFVKQTLVAILDSDPGAHSHRHSHYLAKLRLPHEQERTHLSRSGSAIGSVLGALSDHPAMTAVGSDVLLCALSLSCWAFIRGMDIHKILAATGLSGISASTTPSVSEKSSLASPKTAGRRRKSIVTEDAENPEGKTPKTTRRRKRKSTIAGGENEIESNKAANDSTFHSSSSEPRGEEEQEENPEAGAIGGAFFALGGLGVLAAGILGAT